jgi:hypothetical protein
MTSSSSEPNEDVFSDALRKGLGRAFLWTQSGKAKFEVLLDACLNDYRFDRQVEDSRGDWLWQLVEVGGLTTRFEEPLLEALDNIEASDAASQICQLARHYAASGKELFLSRLYHIVENRPVEDIAWLGEEELIELEGNAGFLSAVKRHGMELNARSWEWFDGLLGNLGIERLGEEAVMNLLDSAGTADGEVRRYAEGWREERTVKADVKRTSYKDRVGTDNADKVIAAAESTESTAFRFRGWGRLASMADLEKVFRRLLETENVESLRRYLQVFATRPWPQFEPRMIELCEHPDANIRRRAATAVANNRHPEVRAFALSKLKEPHFQDAIELLARNYEPGDEAVVLNALTLPTDDNQLHWTLMSLRTLLEDNSGANCLQAVELIYEQTPCSSCRCSAVTLLQDREGLPGPLQSECKYDVEADTRLLVGGPAWSD